jgi:hypothetical protein
MQQSAPKQQLVTDRLLLNATGDVGRKGKPAIHTHLVLLPSTTPPSLAPLPWPVHDQTTAARAASGYYDGVHTTLQALQSWSSSSGSSGGGSSKYDEVPAATLMHERDTAHALPGVCAWRGGWYQGTWLVPCAELPVAPTGAYTEWIRGSIYVRGRGDRWCCGLGSGRPCMQHPSSKGCAAVL